MVEGKNKMLEEDNVSLFVCTSWNCIGEWRQTSAHCQPRY